MTIEADVALWAGRYNLAPEWVQAVVNAEGGGDHIITAVRCSIPSVVDRQEALMILCRSLCHAMSDFLKANNTGAFLDFFAHRWSPPNVANDPMQLNANMAPNLKKFMGVAA